MTDTSEVERIVEIAVLKMDLKYTSALNELRKEMGDSLDEKLSACRAAGDNRRRWSFSAIFTVAMAVIALGSAIAAHWK